MTQLWMVVGVDIFSFCAITILMYLIFEFLFLIFTFLTPGQGQKYELLSGWGKKMITSLSKKRKREGKREKREKKKEKKGKEKKEKRERERKRGKRKEIGKKKEKDGFWLTQENKENLFGKKIIFFPQGERISYIFEM